MNLLEVNELCKNYSTFQLNNVSFKLPKGFIMGYIGENGAGKTTTLNLITHLCHPDSGIVTIDGICYEKHPKEYLESIGFIGDESYFPGEFQLKDIRSILKSMYVSFQEENFNQMITDWKLPEKTKIQDYSRGMKVKLMFAAVLSRDTKLLILDEATNGLDPVMRAEIIEMLQDYIMDGEHSILFSTHVLSDLEQIADYIVFIHQGEILLNETKDELLESYVMVRGAIEDLTKEREKKLIGMTKGAYGFEAILKSQDAEGFGSEFVIEQAGIDQIMLHYIKNGGE
ncbi:MAG: ABC transporter ATP-binding protein [Lachnospiraceae bacterium]|nr:ABC transporter ATP-binding protein [Lachnospiraceae bacterium]